jgi:hypothetical protein
MVDADTLGRWIQPQHLTDDAIAGYREAMTSHPARMVVLERFLVPEAADRLAAFLADEALYDVEHGLYSVEGGVSADAWDGAGRDDRFFRFGKLSGQRPEAMLSDAMLAYVQWRSFVTEPAFHDLFEALTGLELGPSDDFGCHEFNVGDFLREHDDANRSRRVALVMYLTPGWEERHGGGLTMTASDGSVDHRQATFNSMVVFDTLAGSSHRVERIDEAAGDLARRTFGGWFPSPS